MIRRMLLPVLLSVPILLQAQSDVLKISLNGIPKVQFNTTEPYVANAVNAPLVPAGNTWSISIDKADGRTVTISNGNSSDVFAVTNYPAQLTVKNDKLENVSWTFSDRVEIKVTGNNNREWLFKIPYSAGSNVVVPGDNNAKSWKAGSMVYDAQFLNDPQKDNVKKVQILAHYANVDANLQKVQNAYSKNELLKTKVDSICGLIPGAQGAGESFKGGLSSIVSSIGGLDVTNIADGLARFIVKRTKEELNIAFFDNFRDALNDPELVDLRDLFPQTFRTLNVIGDQVYNYNAYMQALRESFEKDLSTLPDNFPEIIDNHPALFAKYPSLAATLRSACYFANALQDNVHPGEMIREFPDSVLNELNPACKGSVQTVQLFSEALRDTANSEDHYWIIGKNVKKTLVDVSTFQWFLGLVDESAMMAYDSVKFTSTVSLAGILNTKNAFDDYKTYRSYVVMMAEKAEALDSMITHYRKESDDSLAYEQYYRYFNASIDFLEYGVKFGKLPHVNLPQLEDSTKKYFEAAHLSADLFIDVNRRNYASAIVNAISLYDIVTNGTVAPPEGKNEKRAASSNEKSVAANESWNKDSKWKMEQALLKYGTFMAAVAQAKSSEEVENAIESFALPPGSARVKRESKFNVSLNAYCGPYYGYEQIRGVDKKFSFNANTYGLTAPLGFSAGWGKIGNHRYHSSFMFFVSAIDIGAVTAFRFKNDSISEVPTILLKDILSPGIFGSYGFRKIPLSLNFGMQVGPNLRKVDIPSAGNTYLDKMYVRYSVSLCVDIPVMNFYTNEGVPKKKK